MSHVDEGRLHAFLDGALGAADPADAERVELHLAACADCRAKLDEAARLRDEAAALLGAATPRPLETPSFASIRARAAAIANEPVAPVAARVDPSRSRGRGWLHASLTSPFNGLAWAATVVLAVGLGWMLHDSLDQPARVPIRSIGGEPVAETRAPSPDPATVRVAEERQAAAAADARDATANDRRSGAAGPAPTPVAAGDASAARVDAMQDLPREEAMAGMDAPPPAAPPPPPPAPERYAAQRRAEHDVAEIAADEAAGMGALAGTPAPAYSVVPGWQPVAVEDARRHAGGDLAVPEGARVISAMVRGSGAGTEVRTVQQTSRGETVTVLQSPGETVTALQWPVVVPRDQVSSRAIVTGEAEAAAPLEAPASREAQGGAVPLPVYSQFTVRWRDWTVTILGALGTDRLRELSEYLP